MDENNNNNDETIEAKQLFLTEEIIKKGYDAQEFSIFLAEQRGEEKIDLEFWSMEDLKKTVEKFKDSLLMKNIEEPTENILKRRHSSVDDTKNRIKNRDSDAIGRKSKYRISKKEEAMNLIEDFEDKNKSDEEEEEEDSDIIKCIKLTENDITHRDDLYIEINKSEKDKKKVITNNTEFIIETKPIGFKCSRKVNDFEYLSHKLSLINIEIYNPYLCINRLQNKDEVSHDTIIYLRFYLNELIQSSYFRTLPIVYDFLTKEKNEWEISKYEKYDEIKNTYKREEIPNLDGYFNLKIDAGDDEKCIKIGEELQKKKDSFKKLNQSIDELLKAFDTININLKNISNAFSELKNGYASSPGNTNLFAHFEIISNLWAKDIDNQKNFFNNEFRLVFQYMNKENIHFMKYYNRFKKSYDIFKSKFEKNKKIVFMSKTDKKILKQTQKEFSFKLVNTYNGYKELNENQAKRIENKLIYFSNNRKNIFKETEDIFDIISSLLKQSLSTKKIIIKDDSKKINE
jgi:hypothetical protein